MSQDNPIEELSDDVEATGQTSDEADKQSSKTSKLLDMNVFEVMLLISLVCVSLATILMLLELRTFGDFPGGFPWRTDEFLVK
jgi:hypothetical protein